MLYHYHDIINLISQIPNRLTFKLANQMINNESSCWESSLWKLGIKYYQKNKKKMTPSLLTSIIWDLQRMAWLLHLSLSLVYYLSLFSPSGMGFFYSLALTFSQKNGQREAVMTQRAKKMLEKKTFFLANWLFNCFHLFHQLCVYLSLSLTPFFST